VSEQLLTILRFALLALLYLFFLRVLRAVWAEIRGPRVSTRRQRAAAVAAPAPSKKARKSGEPHLLVVEPVAQRGRTFPLGQELTVGRAAGCQVTLDDTYVSQLHARVFARDGQYLVEDLGSTNGTYLNRNRVTGAIVMKRGDRLQVGNTVMELA
jgi:pSer/pThr/pTyr-binding forkhead associated (FHA) protein